MNPAEIIMQQGNRTILELQTRIVQAALELNAAQERIVELEKPKEAPKLESVKTDAG